MNTHTASHIATANRFMVCENSNCNQIHVIVPNVNDAHPTCNNCDGRKFRPTDKGSPGYMPEFCDQEKNKKIWDGTMAVTLGAVYSWKADMEKKHNIKFSKNDIQNLATGIAVTSKLMINQSRDAFVKDAFVNKMKGQHRSYLYSQRRKRGKQPTN